ncbi:MAG: hypothetical protein NT162_00595 [Candidatus Woesebacteria bacterium]|nr:hypothetical protein [Candidatus Woesebacteria bacterium]
MWCFGKVNGKFAEVFFENKHGKSIPYAHCFVGESNYETKQEKKWIEQDLKRVNLSFKKNKYSDLKIEN